MTLASDDEDMMLYFWSEPKCFNKNVLERTKCLQFISLSHSFLSTHLSHNEALLEICFTQFAVANVCSF